MDRREYRQKWMRDDLARKRAAYLEENGPCANCGSAENLELDHKDPEQKVSHNIWSWDPVRRAEELAKCQVLCHDCHMDKTVKQRGQRRATHGTETMYRNGCRCDQCKLAHSVVRRRYEAGKRAARLGRL